MNKNDGRRTASLVCVMVLLMFGIVSIAGARAAVVTNVKGTVEIQKAGESTWKPVSVKTELNINDKIQTKKGAMCELQLDDGSLIKLRENSTLEVNDLSEDKVTKNKNSSFKLLIGKLWAKVEPQKGSKFDVITPTAVAGVRGTEFAITVVADGGSEVFVFKGSIEVKDLRKGIVEGKTIVLEAGKALGIKPGEISSPRDLTPQEKTDWQNFLESKTKVEIKITEEERKDIRSDVVQLKQELREHRLSGVEVKKSDFAAGRTMKDRNKELVRVEQRIYRPSANRIRFLNLTMHPGENLHYFQTDLGFTGEIPNSLVGAIAAMASNNATLDKVDVLFANAAPGVANRDEFKAGWQNDNGQEQGYIKINDKDIEPSEMSEPITPDEGKLHMQTTIGINKIDNVTVSGASITMDGYVINNEGDIIGPNYFSGKNLYNTFRNDIGFEVAWDLRGASVPGLLEMKNGGIIDVVFIPDIVFVMTDAIVSEMRNLAVSGNLSFGQ